jgi:hypothetical protein
MAKRAAEEEINVKNKRSNKKVVESASEPEEPEESEDERMISQSEPEDESDGEQLVKQVH